MMQLIWTKRAQNERFKVAAYISANFGKKATYDFVADLSKKRRWIKESPTIGRLEPLLADRVIQYRYLHVGKHNKMIYCVKGNTIYIVDLWDMRREPSRLASRIRSKKK